VARIALIMIVGALAIGAACCGGSDDAPPPPSGPFAEALATVGGGGANGSLGIGWADSAAARALGGPRLVADALGPNADTVVEAAPALERRFGLNPLAAERLVSVGGSYAFGLRLDGLDNRELHDALVHAGGRIRPGPIAELVDVGGYASVPEPLLALDINGLGARDAFGGPGIVLAISDTARASLLGRGGRLIDEPTYATAADCLGDVVAVRMVPAKLLLSTELGANAIAVGVGGGHEVLCVLGVDADRVDEIESSLRAALAPGARDPRSGARVGDSVASADVTGGEERGIRYVRAELQPVAGEQPNFLFGAVSRGSLAEVLSSGAGP
jgi:hypothetical protein